MGDGSGIGRQHPRLVEVVVAEVKRLIVSGALAQGQRLVETQIAEELGVSRNPVREAILSLAADGFVEVEPRRGARVATLSPAEAADLFDVRGALEELAASLAATNGTPEAVAELSAIVDAGVAAAEADDMSELPGLNTAFHVALSEAAGNPQLALVMGPLRDRIQWVYATRVRERAPSSWSEHAAIVAAIAGGDADEARRLAGEHITQAKAAFLATAVERAQ